MSRMPRLGAGCLHRARGAATATVEMVSSDVMRTTALIKEEPKTFLPVVYRMAFSTSLGELFLNKILTSSWLWSSLFR